MLQGSGRLLLPICTDDSTEAVNKPHEPIAPADRTVWAWVREIIHIYGDTRDTRPISLKAPLDRALEFRI